MARSKAASAAVMSLCAACALVVTACGHGSPRVVQPIGETRTSAGSAASEPPREGSDAGGSVGVVVAEDLRRACELPDEPAEAARFDFDSARLRPRGEDILARLASCVAFGRLGDSSLELVGYTDPRGPSDYNEQLGLYRAVAAKLTLVSLGVPSDMLEVRSRGELDARGSNEATWALDRRVEIHRAVRGRAP